MGGPPFDVLFEPAPRGFPAAEHGLDVGHRTLGQPQTLVDAVANGLLVLFGDAEQHPDGAHRHLRAEVPNKIEPARSHQRVEAAGAELAYLRLEIVDVPGGEDPRKQSAMEVVRRRILEDDRSGWQLHAALYELENRAFARDVALPVERAAVDVVETAEGIEVIAFVVIERPLVAESLPHGVGIRVDFEVVRVVVDVGIPRGHRNDPSIKVRRAFSKLNPRLHQPELMGVMSVIRHWRIDIRNDTLIF